nr:polysaccharide pyruvyl transferase family protein [uncultured Duganella sp.]
MELISQLQKQAAAALDRFIQPGQKVAVIDFPHYANAGDSYIWLGEIAYLQQRGASIEYICWHEAFDAALIKRVIGADGVVLFQGGGNFGDRWPEPHRLRLKALRELKGCRMVQFPQTVRFDDPANIAETQQAIIEHGQFVLLTRDHASDRLAREYFGDSCQIQLSPDMAFFIGALAPQRPQADGFVLARTDIEAAGAGAVRHLPLSRLPGRWLSDDWLASDWFEQKLSNQLCKFNSRWNRHAMGRKLMVGLANMTAQARLNRGIRLLSQGKVVLTDRLHAHILCLLLNKPHVVLDNDYGKISTFHQAWTYPSDKAVFARDFDDAVAKVGQLEAAAVA